MARLKRQGTGEVLGGADRGRCALRRKGCRAVGWWRDVTMSLKTTIHLPHVSVVDTNDRNARDRCMLMERYEVREISYGLATAQVPTGSRLLVELKSATSVAASRPRLGRMWALASDSRLGALGRMHACAARMAAAASSDQPSGDDGCGWSFQTS